MVPNLVTSRINTWAEKWPWIFLTISGIVGVCIVVIYYRNQKLQQKHTALMILNMVANNPKIATKDPINDALAGDRLNDFIQKATAIPFIN